MFLINAGSFFCVFVNSLSVAAILFRRCHSVVMEWPSEGISYEEADLVEQAYQYILTKSYPAECSENRKRTIRKKSKRFEVRDGELCYKNKLKGRVSSLVYIQLYTT